jgi:hypothetical protein
MHPPQCRKRIYFTLNCKNMTVKKTRQDTGELERLVPSMGYCIVSNKITVDGMKIGFMYREEPADNDDSGWRFLSGTENQKYLDDESNSDIVDVNTIANADPSIVSYLKMPFGTDLERKEDTDEFHLITG